MNQHVAKVERIDPETGEITEVSPSNSEPTAQAEAAATDPIISDAVAVQVVEERKLPVQPVFKEPEPSLPTPPADRIDDNWGIARFATRGAMHLERYFVMSEKLLWPSILIAVLAVALMVSPMLVGMRFSGGSGAGGGGVKLITLFLPFWAIGMAVTFALFRSAEYEVDGQVVACGGLLIGGVLLYLWMESAGNPNGTAAWIITGVKVVFAVGLILWLTHHIRKSISTGGSRAVLWMAGAYVMVVVVGTLILGSVAAALSGFGPGGMRNIAAMLTYDRDTYFDLGGGLRSGPEYRWMSEYAPNGGLSVAKLNILIAAVRTDSTNHANDAASWEEVTKLEVQPMITRPEKAIRDNAKELPNGIVVVPEGRDPLSIVAYVDGQWSITLVNGQSCAVILGPYDPASDCQNLTTPTQPLNGNARRVLDSIKPIPAAETKE